LSGARARAQATVFARLRVKFARLHDLFASRKLNMASGVLATAVAKRTAFLVDFGVGSTLGTAHFLIFPFFRAAALRRTIGVSTFVHRYLANGRIRWLRKF
jgi:hypothetical protein